MKVTKSDCQFLEIVPQIWKQVQLYMKPQPQYLCSQQPVSCPWCGSDKFSIHSLLFILDPSSVLFLLWPGFPSSLSLVRVATKNVNLFQISPSHATCATNFIILLSTRTVIKNVLVTFSAWLGRLYIWGNLLKARRRWSSLGLYHVFTGGMRKINTYYLLGLANTCSTSLLIPFCVVATFSLVDM